MKQVRDNIVLRKQNGKRDTHHQAQYYFSEDEDHGIGEYIPAKTGGFITIGF